MFPRSSLKQSGLRLNCTSVKTGYLQTSQLGAWLMSSFFAYLGRRLFASIGVLVSVSILIFVIARVIPGDPAHIALGPMASQESIANLRSELYLDRPLPLQYLEFVR